MTRGSAWRRAIVALLLTACAAPLAAGAAGRLHSGAEIFQDRRSESAEVRALIEHATGAAPESAIVVAIDAANRHLLVRRIADAAAAMRSDPHVATVREPVVSRVAGRTRVAVLRAQLRPGTDLAADRSVRRLEDRLGSRPGVVLGGPAVAQSQVDETVARDLARAEAITFPILLVLLLWLFRGLVAACIPLVVGSVSIVLSLAVLAVAARFVNLSIFAMNLVTGLGLGLAIDYGLLVVSRFREELRHDADVARALDRTMRTAGRTVLISSTAVGLTAATLLMFPVPFISSMGAGGLIVAVWSGVVALVALPALLMLLGERVNALAPKRWQVAPDGARWAAFARFVMRRPLVVAAASAAVLVAFALPLLDVHFSFGDASVLPTSQSARVVQDTVADRFGPNIVNPVLIVHRGEAGETNEVGRQLERIARLTTPTPFRSVAPGVQVAEAGIAADPMAPAAERVVREIRAAGPSIAVDGLTAHLVDLKSSLRTELPGAVLAIALVLLVCVTVLSRSLVLGVKTLVVNVLSIGATLGLVVLVFEHLLGHGSVGTAEPIVLSVLALALATDYGAFLLGRVREEHARGYDDREAIARGLETTGRTVTAAALLFCVAMSAFLLSSNVYVQQIGFGVAAGVLIDAFVVRSLLVPSTMCLLGRWNWWAPWRAVPLREAPLRKTESGT